MLTDTTDAIGAAACWELIRRGVLTHDVLPDKQRTNLVMQYQLVREMTEAYGYTDERPARFVPTPRDVSNMMTVWCWLNNLRNERGYGGRDFKLIVARSRGTSWWKLAQKFGRSERQVQRWLDGAVARVYLANRDEVMKLAA